MNLRFEKNRKEAISINSKIHNDRYFSDIEQSNYPEQIIRYLSISGYMNHFIMKNADVYWEESYIRLSPDKGWEKLETKQFNSIDPLCRMSYMKFVSMPVTGFDIYKNGNGEMKGKLFNLFPIINGFGKEVSQSSLITIFCEFLFIPGYIFQDYVKWEKIDSSTVLGTLSDGNITVTGRFHFNSDGLFNRFETDDRYYDLGNGKYKLARFSAIVDSYKTQNDLTIPEKVRIVWNLENGDYEYFKGTIRKIEFDVN